MLGAYIEVEAREALGAFLIFLVHLLILQGKLVFACKMGLKSEKSSRGFLHVSPI
jgi:hypothetical protein